MRVIESLNASFKRLLQEDPKVSILGEDILDPYGGAFKATRGLSTEFGERVLTTPLSENGFVGVACGLSLAGDKPIVEIMFADFIALAFDQVVNFAAKSVSMYGQQKNMNMVIRLPSGGNRAYGATHSQSLHKHFVGVPNLEIYELSAFHDTYELVSRLVNLGRPCLLVEDKILYTQRMGVTGVDDLFEVEAVGGDSDMRRLRIDDPAFTVVCGGGAVQRVAGALETLLTEDELEGEILVPSRLFPTDADSLLEAARTRPIFFVEESTAGGTIGEAWAYQLHRRFHRQMKNPVSVVSSADSIIPSAPHMEREVLVQSEDIVSRIRKEMSND